MCIQLKTLEYCIIHCVPIILLKHEVYDNV